MAASREYRDHPSRDRQGAHRDVNRKKSVERLTNDKTDRKPRCAP
ncbi:MAG: hypothetical protein WBC44_04595 [Planctomycetaceae bacterium]